MNDAPKIYIGIDTAKKHLDACIDGHVRNFENTLKGVERLIKAIGHGKGECHLVFESTGGYERLAAWTLMEQGFAVSIVNAARVRQFAQSMGQMAKTDRIDARIITQYAETAAPRPGKLPPEALRQLASWVRRRRELDDQRVQESNRLDTTVGKDARHDIQLHIRWMQRRLAHIDEQIDRIVAENEQLNAKAQKIRTIRGYGRVSAFTLLAFLPELGTVSRREVAAIAGVAPYNRDSGTTCRKRHISGGRGNLRACLYMAAIAAIRHDGYMQNHFSHLVCDRNKPKKVAIVAVMRKMLIAANSILKNPEFQLAQ